MKYAISITLFWFGAWGFVYSIMDFKHMFRRSRFDEIAGWKAMFLASSWSIIAGVWLLGREIR